MSTTSSLQPGPSTGQSRAAHRAATDHLQYSWQGVNICTIRMRHILVPFQRRWISRCYSSQFLWNQPQPPLLTWDTECKPQGSHASAAPAGKAAFHLCSPGTFCTKTQVLPGIPPVQGILIFRWGGCRARPEQRFQLSLQLAGQVLDAQWYRKCRQHSAWLHPSTCQAVLWAGCHSFAFRTDVALMKVPGSSESSVVVFHISRHVHRAGLKSAPDKCYLVYQVNNFWSPWLLNKLINLKPPAISYITVNSPVSSPAFVSLTPLLCNSNSSLDKLESSINFFVPACVPNSMFSLLRH